MRSYTRQQKNNLKYGAASLVILLVTYFMDLFYFSIHEKDTSKWQEPRMVKTQAVPQDTSAVAFQDLAFVDIALPSPPQEKRQKALFDTPNVATKTIGAVNHVTSNQTAPDADSLSESAKQQTKHLEQLSKLDRQNLQFIFPRSRGEREALQIIEFMHRCIKIDIGSYNGSALSKLTSNNQAHSNLMRLVSGVSTEHEQGIMLTYAKGQQLVRLYPLWFDAQLSKYISNTLGNANLQSLKATYLLKSTGLYLQEIKINESTVHEKWKLAAGC